MTEIQGAIGREQLKKIEKWNKKRNDYQDNIWSFSKKINGIRVPEFKCASCNIYNEKGCRHAAYKCYLFIDPISLKKGWTRDKIIEEINNRNVPCYSGSCSEVYLEDAFKKDNLKPKNKIKKCERAGRNIFNVFSAPNTHKKRNKLYVSNFRRGNEKGYYLNE